MCHTRSDLPPLSSAKLFDLPHTLCASRAIHREGSRSLQLLLEPDMTYFKDHDGKTLMHVAAERGSMAACEVVGERERGSCW